jgi:hypothetical protein
MVVSSVGVSMAEMKVLRTFGDDKTAFTTLLRSLGPLEDALGHMTYDDSGSRPTERRGVAEGRAHETGASLGRKYGRETWNVAGGRVERQL